MFTTVAKWLQTKDKNTNASPVDSDKLAKLVTALMIEAAAADGTVAQSEKDVIISTIKTQFELSNEKAVSIVDDAMIHSEDRIELHSLIRDLRETADYEERIGVMEMVWMVVLSDGRLDNIESQLMRRLAGLLFVSDVDSGLAAKTAKSRLGREE